MLLRGNTEPRTMEDVSRVCGTLGDGGDDKARIVPPEVLRRLPKHSALVINMDLAPAIVRVSRAWKRRGVRKLTSAPALLPVRTEAAEPVLEWADMEPAPAEPAVPPPLPPVSGSANGHGGKPGPPVKTGPGQ